jgi:hypothetical protein
MVVGLDQTGRGLVEVVALEIKQAGDSQVKLAIAIAKGQHSIRVVQKVSVNEIRGDYNSDG